MKKRKVMCFGSFDFFHKGHEFYISQAAKHGEELIIVIARDINIKKKKGFSPMFQENKRCEIVQKHFPHAKVVLGNTKDYYRIIREEKPDILVFGYDQKANKEEIAQLFPHTQLITLPAFQPEKYKSSLLKAKVKK